MSQVPSNQNLSRPVVTLFESYGAGAATIGRALAESLGVPYVDQRFSSRDFENAEAEAAKNAGFLGALIRTLGTAGSAFDGNLNPMLLRHDDEMIASLTQSVWQDAADGGVILGRNATIILADRPNTLHVKLDAPVADRVNRATVIEKISRAEAIERQQREDAARAELSLRLFGWDPRQTTGYDLMVNTSAFPEDVCIRMITDALAAKSRV